MSLNLLTPEIAEVWDRWVAHHRVEDRNRLLEHYMPVVDVVARRIPKPLGVQGEHVDREDLIGYGVFGLVDAIERFDPSLGHRFESYALDRVRGAILDELRKPNEAWVPRGVKDRARAYVAAIGKLQGRLHREPTEEEIAGELGWPVARVRQARVWSANLEASSLSGMVGPLELDRPDVDVNVLADAMAAGIGELSDQHRTVLALYYIEELTFEVLGSVLSISKVRVTQLHTEALVCLADRWGAA